MRKRLFLCGSLALILGLAGCFGKKDKDASGSNAAKAPEDSTTLSAAKLIPENAAICVIAKDLKSVLLKLETLPEVQMSIAKITGNFGLEAKTIAEIEAKGIDISQPVVFYMIAKDCPAIVLAVKDAEALKKALGDSGKREDIDFVFSAKMIAFVDEDGWKTAPNTLDVVKKQLDGSGKSIADSSVFKKSINGVSGDIKVFMDTQRILAIDQTIDEEAKKALQQINALSLGWVVSKPGMKIDAMAQMVATSSAGKLINTCVSKPAPDVLKSLPSPALAALWINGDNNKTLLEIVTAAAEANPDVSIEDFKKQMEQIKQMTADAEGKNGIDLDADVFQNFSGEVVVLATNPNPMDWGVVQLKVKDEAKALNAFIRLEKTAMNQQMKALSRPDPMKPEFTLKTPKATLAIAVKNSAIVIAPTLEAMKALENPQTKMVDSMSANAKTSFMTNGSGALYINVQQAIQIAKMMAPKQAGMISPDMAKLNDLVIHVSVIDGSSVKATVEINHPDAFLGVIIAQATQLSSPPRQ
ncbi:MAG: hypothetical protein ABIH86_05850 [Planctomycetota bacterium]